MPRLERTQMLMQMAELMSARSTCERGQVGCIFSVNGRIICSGYNGSPSGMPHCIDVGCEIHDIGCDRTLHAEAAAISFAARNGIKLEGTSMVITSAPCYNCAKLIINAGIKEVYFKDLYRENRGIQLLKDAGILVKRYAPDKEGEWKIWAPAIDVS